MAQLAYCGLDCSTCSHREKTCPGCQACAGKMFWGECDLAKCCIGKGLENCGKCSDFPCEQLKAYSYAGPPDGDDGRRIRNLQNLK